jgi:hypothetical protein
VSGLKETYIVATDAIEPLSPEALREAFETDEVTITFGADEGAYFAVQADEARVVVAFEVRSTPLGWTPELLTGTPELRERLEKARGFYRLSFEYGKPQSSVAVFEALWAARLLTELVDGMLVDVTAYKLHSAHDAEEITELDFDIRDHVTIHAMELGEQHKLWVHTHGLAKFASPEVEMFNITEDDLPAAETFFHELCTDLAFGQGPSPRQVVSTSVGMSFMLLPAEEGRASVYSANDPEAFEGHAAGYLTVVSGEGKHTLGEILGQYRERFEEESDEEAAALNGVAERLLPAFKARFQRKGLMEPLTFLVRAPFETHPEGEKGDAGEELLWVEVIQWNDESLIGKLVDGGQTSTEWRKGSHVEVDDSQINALGLSREGKPLDPQEMEALLEAERPA